MRIGALAISVLVLAAACSPSPEVPLSEAPASVEPEPLDPGAPAAEQAALSGCGPVTAEGFCGVTFGMAPKEALTKFPVKLEVYSGGDPAAQADPNRCFEMLAAEPVQGVSFLVEMNKVGRLDILSESAKTVDGFGVGTSAADIKAKFGAGVSEQPNKYEPEIAELVVPRGAAKFIFEIQDTKVRAWRAGIMPTIDYVEHCG
ncbi:MAG: hypothetical protein Q8R02_12060 [Hyphomonadaceae bacterium]|nr:hypothetical protein [Hyphomonadaceae bacterium]